MKPLFILTAFILSGCATLDQGGEKVQTVTTVGKDCKNLGPVNVSVVMWGLPVEITNVLRNNTAEVGGNTMIQTAEASGIAYNCPLNSETR